MKSWSRRYFVLSPQSLCYFRSELHEKLEPLGRIFLSDIVSISNESTEKKKAFVFVLHTKKRAVLLQAANTEDREQWIESIKQASEIDKEAERKDPFRKSLRRLTPGKKLIYNTPYNCKRNGGGILCRGVLLLRRIVLGQRQVLGIKVSLIISSLYERFCIHI